MRSWDEFATLNEKACGPAVPARQKRYFDAIALTVAETAAALELRDVFSKADLMKCVAAAACTQRGLGRV